jgi:general secretion pathway protein G
MRTSSRVASIVFAISFSVLVFGAVTLPTHTGGSGHLGQARADVSNLGQAVKLFAGDTGALPTNEQGLGILVNGVPQLLDRLPHDPWGHAYVYRRIAVSPGFEIHSVGRDGIDEGGSGDDIALSDEAPVAGPFLLGLLVASFLASLAVLAFNAAGFILRRSRRRQTQ